MRKIILIASILSATFSVKATNFNLVIANVDTAYAHWHLSSLVVTADTSAITSLGLRPVPPNYDSTNSNWSTYTTAASTWDSSSTALQDSLLIHSSTNRANELTLLTALGYKTAFSNTPVNQWIMVQGGNFTTVWIGYALNTDYIQITTVRPVSAFPKKN